MNLEKTSKKEFATMKTIIYLSIFILMLSCNSIHKKHLSSLKFEKEYNQSKMMHTMKSYEAPFIENSYVFKKKREMSFINKDNWTETLIYTPKKLAKAKL